MAVVEQERIHSAGVSDSVHPGSPMVKTGAANVTSVLQGNKFDSHDVAGNLHFA